MVTTSDGRSLNLEEYFMEFPLEIRCSKGEVIEGNQLADYTTLANSPFNKDAIEIINWKSHKVNIKKEFGSPDSLHAWLESELPKRHKDSIIFYDHGAGEMGDFVVFNVEDKDKIVAIYHVKRCKSGKPGESVSDIYEVCGQVEKSVKYRRLSFKNLVDKISRRINIVRGRKFVTGDLNGTKGLIDNIETFSLRIILVQPGILSSKISDKSEDVLAAAQSYVLPERDDFKIFSS